MGQFSLVLLYWDLLWLPGKRIRVFCGLAALLGPDSQVTPLKGTLRMIPGTKRSPDTYTISITGRTKSSDPNLVAAGQDVYTCRPVCMHVHLHASTEFSMKAKTYGMQAKTEQFISQ